MLTMKRGGGGRKSEKVFLVTKIGMPQIKRKGKSETNAPLPPFLLEEAEFESRAL